MKAIKNKNKKTAKFFKVLKNSIKETKVYKQEKWTIKLQKYQIYEGIYPQTLLNMKQVS